MTDTIDPTPTPEPTPDTYSADALLMHEDAMRAHDDAVAAGIRADMILQALETQAITQASGISAVIDNTAAIRTHAAVADAVPPDHALLLAFMLDQAGGTRTAKAVATRALDLLAVYKGAVLTLGKPPGTV